MAPRSQRARRGVARAQPRQAGTKAPVHPARAGTGALTEAGFTLIGLMVLIAVINIGLAVAVTSWAMIDKRAREAELIWRGRQYVRAIQCHRQQTGALPEKLDDLLESDCIRALYPDPMTRDGVWRVIRESDLRSDRGTSPSDAESSVLDTLGRQMRTVGMDPDAPTMPPSAGQGDTADVSESLQTAYERLRNLTERLRQDFASSGNGIVGVVSRSPAEALRLYEGETTYDAWRFLAR